MCYGRIGQTCLPHASARANNIHNIALTYCICRVDHRIDIAETTVSADSCSPQVRCTKKAPKILFGGMKLSSVQKLNRSLNI